MYVYTPMPYYSKCLPGYPPPLLPYIGISVNDDILSQTNPLLVVNHRTNAP